MTIRPIIAITLFSLLSTSAIAAWPEKPMRLVLPFPPGGGADIMARPMAQKLTETLGQPVLIDNKGGAGGTVAAEFVAKAPADGYTLFFATVGTQAINVGLYPKLGYDPVRDFAPIALTHNAPRILIVHPSIPAKSVAELITYAKANPGKLSFASAGSGGTNHLSGELFKMMTGVDMVHVPYKGAGPAVADVLAGRVQLTFDSIPVWIPHIKSNKVRALGVTSLQRSATVPDLPTISESGLKGFDVSNWLGVFAPANTSRDIVSRLNGELKKIMADTEIRRQLVEQGVEAMYTTPEALGELVRKDIEKWTKLVKLSGAKPD